MMGPLSKINEEIFVKFLFCFLFGVEDAQGEDKFSGYVHFVRLLKRDVSRQLDVGDWS